MEKMRFKVNLRLIHYLINFIAYDVVWFVAVLSAQGSYRVSGFLTTIAISALQIIWQVYFYKESKHFLKFISLMTLAGCAVDLFLIKVGVFQFTNQFITILGLPIFLIAIWLNFNILFYATLRPLISKPFILGLLSFIGFMLAYGLASNLGVVQLGFGLYSILTVGIIWLLLLPAILLIFNSFFPIEIKK